MWTEADDKEQKYGVWHAYTLKRNFAEAAKIHPRDELKEIWPHWNDGVPTRFRRRVHYPYVFNGGVRHQPITVLTSLELQWGNLYMLSQLREHKRLLPSTYKSEWSGVYRLVSKGAIIDRCCGRDSTGTLYIGRACAKGSKSGNWSILRTRIQQILSREHHAMRNWSSNDLLRDKYPWDSLAIEWAYTAMERRDYLGERHPEAILAEGWLLGSYDDSFGELPPWNLRR